MDDPDPFTDGHDYTCVIRPGDRGDDPVPALQRRVERIEEELGYIKRELRRLGRDDR